VAVVTALDLFYVGGDFRSRKGAAIEMGSLTLHPAGFVHGPQPVNSTVPELRRVRSGHDGILPGGPVRLRRRCPAPGVELGHAELKS
jgi:hypothetical protein